MSRKTKKKNNKLKIFILFICILLVVGLICKYKYDHRELTTEEKMQQLYYYDENRAERYSKYMKEHPELSYDEVVWRVDADIDKEYYDDMVTIDEEDENDLSIIINKHYRLRDNYEPKELVTLIGNYQVTPETYKQFKEMESVANKEGINFYIASAYRSIETQQMLYDAYVAKDGKESAETYSAHPYSSEHHTGRAIDMTDPNIMTREAYANTEAYVWLQKNAYKYGFIFRYGKDIQDVTGYMYEAWHITYVGTETSTTMHDENIESLEEYWVKYVKYSKNSKK